MTRLEAIEARVRAATPGPWRWVYEDDESEWDCRSYLNGILALRPTWSDEGMDDVVCSSEWGDNPADGALLAHSRTDVADLLRWVRVLRDEVLSLTELINFGERPLECIVEPQAAAVLREMEAMDE